MTNFAAIKNKYETKMKNLFLLLTIWLTASNLQAAQPTDTLTWRIKSMRCEDCAHKVNNALRKNPAIDGVSFDLEKRTVTIAYDGTRTCPDSIVNNLRGTRYKPSPYDPTEVIHRGIGLQMADMHCQNCANRIMKRLSEVEGVDSIAPHVDKHYVFFRYDANKTTKATIREILQGMGFTPLKAERLCDVFDHAVEELLRRFGINEHHGIERVVLQPVAAVDDFPFFHRDETERINRAAFFLKEALKFIDIDYFLRKVTIMPFHRLYYPDSKRIRQRRFQLFVFFRVRSCIN